MSEQHRRKLIQIAFRTSVIFCLLVSFGVWEITAASGDLDPTFGIGGKLTDGLLRGDEAARGIASQADGKIVVAGSCWTGLSHDFAIARYNTNGSLDTAFGIGGKVTTDIASSDDQAYAVVIQPDGKIIVAGGSLLQTGFVFSLVRYNSNGSLDASFGIGGRVTTDIGPSYEWAYSVAVGPDGKIVAAGTFYNNSNGDDRDFAVVRYNNDGSLDTTFDGDGKVTTSLSPGSDQARSVVIQADSKIVAGGESSSHTVPGPKSALVRYNADGSLDASFDGDGILTSSSPGSSFSVAIQADGKIVAAGSNGFAGIFSNLIVARFSSNGSPDGVFATSLTMPAFWGRTEDQSVVLQPDGKIVVASRFAPGGGYTSEFQVVRLNANLSLDPTFGTDGTVTTPVGFNTGPYSVAVLPDGKIVAAGTSWSSPDLGLDLDFAVVRYNTDGSLDTSFDVDGKVTTDFGFFRNVLNDTAIQPDGKIVAAGEVNANFVVVRYNADGTSDTSFGGTGKVSTDMGSTGDRARAVAIQTDGKIVVGGGSYDMDDNQCCFALARYNADGSLDTTFSGDGKVITGGHDGTGILGDGAFDIVIQPDGKIVAAGNRWDSQSGFVVIRYNTDGSLDTSFDGDGIVTTPVGSNASATSVAIQPDGKIVAAGNSASRFAIVRYSSNGSLDTAFDGDGIATTSIGPWSGINSIAIQTDGKIVAAGDNDNGFASEFAVVRYDANGSLDTSFDGDGIVTTLFGGEPGGTVSSIAIQSDGKLVVVGTEGTLTADFAAVRYRPNGSLDTLFGGGDGKTTIDFNNSNDYAYGMALDNAGRAVVVGESDGRFAIARFLLTAAEVSISGRVTTANGRGIGNAVVSMIDSLGVRRTTRTSAFGYYSFTNIPGGTYNLAVRSKRYEFQPRTVFVDEVLSGFDFVALN